MILERSTRFSSITKTLFWAYKPHPTHTFLLAFEIEFDRGLYLCDEGYDTEVNYDLLFTAMWSPQQKLFLPPWVPSEVLHPSSQSSPW